MPAKFYIIENIRRRKLKRNLKTELTDFIKTLNIIE